MTTNTTFSQTCSAAAEEITQLLDVLGFTSDEQHTDVNNRIAEIIQRHVQSNPLSVFSDLPIVPTSTLMNEMIEEIEKEESISTKMVAPHLEKDDDVPF